MREGTRGSRGARVEQHGSLRSGRDDGRNSNIRESRKTDDGTVAQLLSSSSEGWVRTRTCKQKEEEIGMQMPAFDGAGEGYIYASPRE
jgi:hypothetical protein